MNNERTYTRTTLNHSEIITRYVLISEFPFWFCKKKKNTSSSISTIQFCARQAGCMVNALDSGSRGLGPKPRFVIVLCFPSRHSTLTVLLSTQDKWALADCQGNLIKFLRGEGGNPCDGPTSHWGGRGIIALETEINSDLMSHLVHVDFDLSDVQGKTPKSRHHSISW